MYNNFKQVVILLGGDCIITYKIKSIEKMGIETAASPYKALASDGNYYVVKFYENNNGPRVLINEYICYKIMKEIGINVPDAAFIIYDGNEQLNLEIHGEFQKIGVFPAFGSKYIPNLLPLLPNYDFSIIKNKKIMLETLLFDIVFQNVDRGLNYGNMLYDSYSDIIIPIDHERTFHTASLWDHRLLQQTKDIYESYDLLDNDSIYIALLESFSVKCVNNLLENAKNKYVNITEGFLNNIMDGIPNEWCLLPIDRKAIIEYILYRITNIDNSINVITNYIRR